MLAPPEVQTGQYTSFSSSESSRKNCNYAWNTDRLRHALAQGRCRPDTTLRASCRPDPVRINGAPKVDAQHPVQPAAHEALAIKPIGEGNAKCRFQAMMSLLGISEPVESRSHSPYDPDFKSFSLYDLASHERQTFALQSHRDLLPAGYAVERRAASLVSRLGRHPTTPASPRANLLVFPRAKPWGNA